ncbi:MAG TPA: hypothetical protein VFG50_07865 [Rhodothermales bacterium]|nr:hypothetical protein [Rhodothermales bacterium]
MPGKSQSVLLAGVAVGVIVTLFSFIPVLGGCLGCIAYLIAGGLAVWHYANTYELTVLGGTGAGMGAVAGVLAGIVSGLIGWLFEVSGLRPSAADQMMKALENSNLSPEQMDQFSSMFTSPVFWVVLVGVGLIIGAIVGAIGGAIGASMFKRGPEPSSDVI